MGRCTGRAVLALLVVVGIVLSSGGAALAAPTTGPQILGKWSPGDVGGVTGYTPVAPRALPHVSRDECSNEVRAWKGPEDGVGVVLQWMPCQTTAGAQRNARWQLPHGEGVSEGSRSLFGGADRTRAVRVPGGSAMMRTWVEDDVGVVLITYCRQVPACVRSSETFTKDLESRLVGPPLIVSADTGQALFTGPLLGWLVLVGPTRLGDRLGEGGYGSRDAPGYTDVTPTARRVRRLRRRRAIARTVAVLAAAAFFAYAYQRDWRAVVALVLAWKAKNVARRAGYGVPRGRAMLGVKLSTTSVLGWLLRTAANLGALAAVVWYLACLVASLLLQEEPTLYLQAEQAAGTDPSLVERVKLNVLFWGGVGGAGASRYLLMVAVAAGAVLYLVDRLGRRLTANSAHQALEWDDRPYFLYLRSFDEDKARISATLSRRGLLAKLSMRKRHRFEEVLVGHLAAFGPVIAVSPPGRRLPTLGAAKASLSNDEWQANVERWAHDALAVVLSGTPKSVRAGYGWEINLVAERCGHERVLVVLAPWNQKELRQRWRGFLAFVSDKALFAPMAAVQQDGVQMLAHVERQGWQAWGGRRRYEDSYAASVVGALEWAGPQWAQDLGASRTDEQAVPA